MGDFYVDDQFFDHPKALAAGEDAANLCVRAWAWAHRHNTGILPAEALRTLTAKPNPKALAAKLVGAGLWHVVEGGWELHDWQTRNAKMIAKRDQAKKAAAARWEQYRNRADARADASDPHSVSKADAMPYHQGTKDQGAAAASLTVTHDPPDPSPAAAGRPDWETLPRRTFEVIADRRLAANPQVNNPDAYRASILRALPDQYAGKLADIDLGDGWSPESLADHLEPQRPKATNGATTSADGRTFMPGSGLLADWSA